METGGEEKGGGLTDTESRKMCVPRQESMADAIAKKRGKKKTVYESCFVTGRRHTISKPKRNADTWLTPNPR
jgi:hypothetical protein